MVGATPVFVDVGGDQNIDPQNIEPAITKRTKAIMPVHFTGRLCDMKMISDIAQENDLWVIEDAAQAMGAETTEYKAGSVGDVAILSLNPMKVFPGYGESGAVLTDNPEIDQRLRVTRYLGMKENEIFEEIELNHKMDEIQAAMSLTGFLDIDGIVNARIKMARQYSRSLATSVSCPTVPELNDRSSNFYDYVIFVDDRDGLRKHLDIKGIETKIKHLELLSEHPGCSGQSRPKLPVADSIVKRMVSLPLHDKMTVSDIDYVCDTVRDYCCG